MTYETRNLEDWNAFERWVDDMVDAVLLLFSIDLWRLNMECFYF